MEKYYYKTKVDDDGRVECLESCKVKFENWRIGCLACKQDCSHCKENGNDDKGFWIKCEKIEEATGKKLNQLNK